MLYKLRIHIEEIDEYTGKSEHYESGQIGPSFNKAVEVHKWADRLKALSQQDLASREKED